MEIMKIGDKVRITKSGLVGFIIGETADAWKIDFINGDKPELVSKDTPMEVIIIGTGQGGGSNTRPKEKKKWLLIAVIILLIGCAIAVTIINTIG